MGSQAFVADKAVFSDLIKSLTHFSEEYEEALRSLENQLRKDREFVQQRMVAWYKLLERCQRQNAILRNPRSDEQLRRSLADRSMHRQFIECQRSGIRALDNKYSSDYYLPESVISSLGFNELLRETEIRFLQAKRSKLAFDEAIERFHKDSATIKQLIEKQKHQSIPLLHRLRQRVEAYTQIGIVQAIALSIANVFRQHSNGDAVDLNDCSAVDTLSEHVDDGFLITRKVFTEYYASMFEQGFEVDPTSGALQHPDFPDIEFMPNGDVFGSYNQLTKFLNEEKLSQHRGSDIVGIEAHHLIEDRLMQYFGISKDEGLAVAIYAHEHMQSVHGEFGIDIFLPRSKPSEGGYAYAISDVVDGHAQAYQELGRPEWAEKAKVFITQCRGQILDAYRSGLFPSARAEDIEEAREYLDNLERVAARKY